MREARQQKRVREERMRVYACDGKLPSMTRSSISGLFVKLHDGRVRTLDIRGMERMHGLDDDYTAADRPGGVALAVSNRAKLVCLGFHVRVVEWILRHIPDL